MRHHVYDSIQTVLADGEWHDASELEQVTRFADDWISELGRERELVVWEENDRILVRSLASPRTGSAGRR